MKIRMEVEEREIQFVILSERLDADIGQRGKKRKSEKAKKRENSGRQR